MKTPLVVTLGLMLCRVAVADPVTLKHIIRHDPNESIHIVTIDLSDPSVSAHVDRVGPDPDGDGPWQTTLLPTTEIAERDGWDVAVNGDFFQAEKTVDIEGKNTGFVRGKRARPDGPAVTDGRQWSTNATTRPALEILADKSARIETVPGGAKLHGDVREAIAGSQMLVMDGKRVDQKGSLSTTRHPRTCVGIDKTGRRLILLVVDGRQPSLSVGMSEAELSDELIAVGAWWALNLDGGGSSTLVYRDPATKKLRILNSPSDTKERSVADALGFKVATPLPTVGE